MYSFWNSAADVNKHRAWTKYCLLLYRMCSEYWCAQSGGVYLRRDGILVPGNRRWSLSEKKKFVAACNRCVRPAATATRCRRLQELRRLSACDPGIAGLLNNALVEDVNGRCELRSDQVSRAPITPTTLVDCHVLYVRNKGTNERFRTNETNERTNDFEWTNFNYVRFFFSNDTFWIDAFRYWIIISRGCVKYPKIIF